MDLSKYWKTIVDTLQDGLMVVDPKGTIMAVNPAAEKLTGYTAAELVGQNCRVLDCTGCEIFGRGSGELWCSLFAKGNVRAKQCMITRKSKRILNIVKNASVLRDAQGQMVGSIELLKDMSEMVRQQQEIAALRQSCRLDDGHHGLIGDTPVMMQLFELIESVAQSEAPVLVLGESGTGKELVARAIHEAGARHNGPYIKVNCAALNENLLESELFGHVKGAFTGAAATRMGRFEAAHGGTIFLDEIGDIPLATQVKLLRVLEEKEIERVGDHRPVTVDVRIITATNKDLEQLIAQGRFREDLYFRINVFPLTCPTLSQRKDDIPAIVQYLLDARHADNGQRVRGLTPKALELLAAYPWPGNVRELRNTIEYAMVLCAGQWIDAEHLPPRIRDASRPVVSAASHRSTSPHERQQLLEALRAADGNQSAAAKTLGVSRVTVWKRIKRHGIDLLKEL